ncbi:MULTISPECIES: DUF6494 family protein [unclassified Ferrimonas]|uniref:DUF6494 family protein n=1 Tax=unclassified Ferrimonas TaxID=2620587 RepID=UPI00257336E8|nr:DUF6494 family protein [Ferrimonas sp. YFM]BDY06571.1 hypothetical protein F0521_36120 [Ferrimonas sp. YFM]
MSVDKELLNQSIRRFLKEVGIKSHQTLEHSILEQADKLSDTVAIKVTMTLEVDSLELEQRVEGLLSLRDQ